MFDYRHDRLSILDADGDFVRSTPIRLGGHFWLLDIARDGRLVLSEESTPHRHGHIIPTTTVWDSVRIIALDERTGRADTLAHLAASRRTAGHRSGQYYFEPHMGFALADSGFYSGTTDVLDIAWHDREGRVVRRIRRAGEPPPFTDADWERFKVESVAHLKSLGGSARAEASFYEQSLKTAKHGDRRLAYQRLLVDEVGHLWVEHHRLLGERASTWSVFAPHGAWLGDVPMPDGLDVRQIGHDWVLGLWRNEDGVWFIRRHRLVRR